MGLLRRAPVVAGRRAVPWLLVLELLRQGQEHWKQQLSPRERSRAIALIKASKGRPGALSAREQQELRELATKLDLKGFGTRAALSTAGRRVGRRH
jgi:hypothetical protein